MIHSLLAFSIDNSFTKVGAVVAFAALVGIAILSLLVFSQAREIRRLREWAGRAPERSAEMEQRISAQAAARAVQASQIAGARPVPRTTPLNVRAAAVPQTPTRTAPAATLAANAQAQTAPDTQAAPAQDMPAPPGDEEQPETAQSREQAGTSETDPSSDAEQQAVEVNDQESEADKAPTEEPSLPSTDSAPNTTPGEADKTTEAEQETNPAEQVGNLPPAPLTAAARANIARAPQPPPPVQPESLDDEPADGPSRPPGTGRPPAPLISASRSAASLPPRRQGGTPVPRGGSYKFLNEDEGRSPRRTTAIVIGGVIVVIVAIVLALTSLGGSKNGSQPSGLSTTTLKKAHTLTQAKKSVNPGAVSVVVLNGTQINQLAHKLAASLRDKGYRLAKPLSALPAGSWPKTVVEYTPDHSADAQSIAQTLDISLSEVRPIESSMSTLVSSASVVVIAGNDQPAPAPAGSATEELAGENAGAAEGSSESAASATG